MQDNINEIISNALSVNKVDLKQNLKQVITQLKKAFESNKDVILQTNAIDKKNNNGFIIDFEIINNIFENLKNENIIYGNVTLSQKDDDKKLIYGKQIMDCGNVVVINDGNPYVIIEMTIRNILAGNTTIFSNNGYMFGSNKLLIQIIQSVLEKFNISKNLVQIYVSESFEEILSNYANIDLVVCVGNHHLQSLISKISRNRTIYSGYENFDLYIENTENLEFLNKVVNTGLNIQLYINKKTNFDYGNAILVDDIEEAIAQINYNGSRYSTSIFTTSTENASRFVREVKSNIVTVNTSPTIERLFDIKQIDLVNERTIIYPFNFKVDGNVQNIHLNNGEDL